ncbi:hypothetical protein CF319_g7249 [Tilletia indica]|nr:hypothetical protein CF319_g7249 [Tilletia indica]
MHPRAPTSPLKPPLRSEPARLGPRQNRLVLQLGSGGEVPRKDQAPPSQRVTRLPPQLDLHLCLDLKFHLNPSQSVKTKAKKAKTPSSSKAVTEEDVPVGGTVERRAQNVDESQRAAAVDRLMQKANDAAAKLAEDSSNIASDAASSASGAAAKVASKIASATSDVASAATKVSHQATKASSKVSSAATEAASCASAKVASAATDASTAAESIASKVADKVSKTVEQVNTLNNAAQKVVDTASAVTDSVKGSTEKNKSEKILLDSVEDVIMSTSVDHLLDSLASYLGEVTPGGAAAWKIEFVAQVEQARQAARDAILNALNKEAAQQIALGAEKWLLEAVKFDGEKLGRGEDSTEDELEGQIKLSIEQKKKLNEMGKTLRKRIAAREAALKKKEKAEKKKEKTHDEL